MRPHLAVGVPVQPVGCLCALLSIDTLADVLSATATLERVNAPSGDGPSLEQPPLATVVVPARNEERAIEACLESILAQDEPRLQVIVVDGASTDRTVDLVRSMASRDRRIELLTNPEGVIPVSLNLALAAARAPWLVRVDAHASVPPDYVRLAVQRLSTGRWGAVGGRKDGVGTTPAGRAIAAAMASPFGVGNSRYHYATEPSTVDHVPFGAYPVELARSLGGWDEALRVNQDFEFDYRLRAAGHEILFDPALRIDWECRQSIGALFQQYRRYGRGKVNVARLHPDSVAARHLAAPALVAWLLAALLVGLRSRRAAVALLAPYAAGVALASARTAARVDAEARPWLAPAFGAMHVGWGIGFWQGVIEGVRDSSS